MKKAVFVDLLNLFWDQHGIYSLTSVMKQNNIDVRFVGTRNFSKALAVIQEIKPDVLLYSAFSAVLLTCIEFDKIVKEKLNLRSVIGGPGPTYDWQKIKTSTIDAVCVGEGEKALVDFINNGFTGHKNIFCREENFPSEFYPLVDLDSLPFPDRKVIYESDSLLRDTPSKQFISGRGCPYDCTYCFNHKFREMFKGCGPVIRRKSVDYLLEEIKRVKREYPLSNVVFHDDTFILDKKWFLEFCSRFPREIGITYDCNIRANLVDEEIAVALRDSKCKSINWSIESGNEFFRNKILRRRMTNEQILNTANLLTKYGLTYRIGNVIGLPGEKFEQMFETVDLNIKSKPYMGLANIFVPFPGLELTEYAKNQGYYSEKSESGELPKDYFTKSALNITKSENTKIYKLMCLFPVFVNMPFLFYNLRWRRTLFLVPRFMLRLIYETIYTYKMSKMYERQALFGQKARMAVRYIKNL